MTPALVIAIAFAAAVQSGAVDFIARDSMSGVDEPRQAAAVTAGEWAALWRQHAPDKPLPKVDFTTRSVVAIFLGSRPTAGYDLEILGTKREGDTVVVEWAEVRPKQGLLLAQVLTSPALIATIPKTPGAGTIAFRKVTR
jgi:PrcB C-terminal